MSTLLVQRAIAGFMAIVCVATASPVFADSKEYLVKAAFLYNFVKFTEWPAPKALSQQSSIDICVLGDSPIASTGSIFTEASTPQLRLSLVREADAKNIANHCHIVYISSSEEGNIEEILSLLREKPVLTVSDIGGFAKTGGMVGFVVIGNKIKIEVNKRAVTETGMRIDAQLLEIAHKVFDK